MSAWDIIESLVMSQPISLPLGRRELYVVREAHAAWVRRTLDEVSVWDVLEKVQTLSEAPGGMTKAIKGLTPHEAQLIQHFDSNVRSKTGNSGEVIALPPKDWQRIRQEIDANPEYYDNLLGGVVSSQDLSKKIESQLSLAMGKKPAAEPKPPTDVDPELSGDPEEMTPSIQGSDQYRMDEPRPDLGQTGGDSPFASKAGGHGAPPNPVSAPAPESPEARRRRVAAQDMALMGAKGKGDVDRMTGAGRMKVSGREDR
jgi:hypothetical protein